MNYDRLALTAQEQNDLRALRDARPFRRWFAVKAEHHEAAYFPDRRRAMRYAKKLAERAAPGQVRIHELIPV